MGSKLTPPAANAFGKKLHALRTTHRYSQAALARAVGVAQTTLSQWERGDGTPTLEVALRLARVLDVDLGYLAGTKPKTTPAEAEAVRMVRALGLDEAEVIRRLAGPIPEEPGGARP